MAVPEIKRPVSVPEFIVFSSCPRRTEAVEIKIPALSLGAPGERAEKCRNSSGRAGLQGLPFRIRSGVDKDSPGKPHPRLCLTPARYGEPHERCERCLAPARASRERWLPPLLRAADTECLPGNHDATQSVPSLQLPAASEASRLIATSWMVVMSGAAGAKPVVHVQHAKAAPLATGA